VEGAWDEDGKLSWASAILNPLLTFYAPGRGPSAWEYWTHENNGSNIANGHNGDVACDSYHKFAEDTARLSNMGVREWDLPRNGNLENACAKSLVLIGKLLQTLTFMAPNPAYRDYL